MKALLIGDDPTEPILLGPSEMPIAVDTETTGLKWSDELLGISLAWPTPDGFGSCYLQALPEGRDVQLGLFTENDSEIPIEPLLRHAFQRHPVVAHYLPFDYRVLYKALRIDPPERPWDTLHIARNLAFHDSYRLDRLATRYLGEVPGWVSSMKSARHNLKELEPSLVARYARWDAETTLRLFQRLHKISVRNLPAGQMQRDQRFTNLVMRLVNRGVPINREWCQARRLQLLALARESAGRLAGRGLANPGSDDQVARFINDVLNIRMELKTNAGRDSTSLEALEQYLSVPDIAEIVNYRQLIKGVGSWLEPLLDMSEEDGRAHSILDPFGTRSFRMSSSDINLQAVPIKDRHRAFGGLAAALDNPAWPRRILSADIKQAEVRLSAILAKENALAQVLAEGSDPYINMSKRVWGTSDFRDEAKRAVLASIYEIGPKTFAHRYHVTEDAARATLGTFRAAFPALGKASKDWSRYCDASGGVPLYTDRMRWFGPDEEHYKAFNQRVQGSVAELMAGAMLEFESRHPGLLINQVHDSIWVEADYANPAEIETLSADIRSIVAEVLPGPIQDTVVPRVPMLVDIGPLKE